MPECGTLVTAAVSSYDAGVEVQRSYQPHLTSACFSLGSSSSHCCPMSPWSVLSKHAAMLHIAPTCRRCSLRPVHVSCSMRLPLSSVHVATPQADRRALNITMNSIGTELTRDDRRKLYSNFGLLYPHGHSELASAEDFDQIRSAMEKCPPYQAIFTKVIATTWLCMLSPHDHQLSHAAWQLPCWCLSLLPYPLVNLSSLHGIWQLFMPDSPGQAHLKTGWAHHCHLQLATL